MLLLSLTSCRRKKDLLAPSRSLQSSCKLIFAVKMPPSPFALSCGSSGLDATRKRKKGKQYGGKSSWRMGLSRWKKGMGALGRLQLVPCSSLGVPTDRWTWAWLPPQAAGHSLTVLLCNDGAEPLLAWIQPRLALFLLVDLSPSRLDTKSMGYAFPLSPVSRVWGFLDSSPSFTINHNQPENKSCWYSPRFCSVSRCMVLDTASDQNEV